MQKIKEKEQKEKRAKMSLEKCSGYEKWVDVTKAVS